MSDDQSAYDRLSLTTAMLLGGGLLILGTGILVALAAGAPAIAGGGMLAVWTLLLAWSLWFLRDRLAAAWWWGLMAAGTLSVLAQMMLLLVGPGVFMQVNFVSLHVWALLCTGALAVYACFAPREERLPVGLSIAAALILVAQLPFTPRPLAGVLVATLLGVLPALGVAWLVLRFPLATARELLTRAARAPRSPPNEGARKLPAWPDAETPGALISN